MVSEAEQELESLFLTENGDFQLVFQNGDRKIFSREALEKAGREAELDSVQEISEAEFNQMLKRNQKLEEKERSSTLKSIKSSLIRSDLFSQKVSLGKEGKIEVEEEQKKKEVDEKQEQKKEGGAIEVRSPEQKEEKQRDGLDQKSKKGELETLKELLQSGSKLLSEIAEKLSTVIALLR